MSLEELFVNIQHEAFRLEKLEFYAIEAEQESYQRFLNGKIEIDETTMKFCEIIKRLVREGKKIIRVRVLPKKMNDYIRFEIKTGYIPQVKAGAKIYIIKKHQFEKLVKSLDFDVNDFWMFDEKIVIELLYDEKGRFLKESVITQKNQIEKYLILKQTLLEYSTPLEIWLKENPI